MARSLGRKRIAAMVLAIAGLACALTWLIARYWRYYHLETPGSAVGLLFVLLPGAMIVGVMIGLLVAKTRAPSAHPMVTGLGVVALLFALSFVFEVWRTTDLRNAEGEGAGDLRPFIASLL